MAEQQKKMNVVQLTFIVTVNMMGSGIIMLPANMAQVGAISLLSWLVTAVGSMAIAYGFAQAGILNQRAGGMAAYAEDAYGKPGYFQVFFLYFISLAIANVAVASSALGYLAAFFPKLTATPILSCIGVIALLWLTTVANFGGPKLTGRLGSITVWGVILPVGFMSFFGWFWFKGETFAAAWNPHGLSLFEGMGSSISLTLWAFLGMESAVQNSSAVENPKRNVPLASLFGTLGAAVIYILSTTAIQGIVPNAELAKSTGPFGLAFAQMFTPAIGQLVMALAAMACIGSLLGWQFTLAQTAKDAADTGMFPAVFGKSNHLGAPITGMIIMGVVQSIMALSTISPNLSEQFSALVNLAVVTNVLPYIIALSALFVMMRAAGVEPATYRRNAIIAVVALLYSIYALFAAGQEAVLGGMLVMAAGYVIYGIFTSRFTGGGTAPRTVTGAAVCLLALVAAFYSPPARPQSTTAAAPAPAQATAATAPTSVLQRIAQTGELRLGYRTDARPFSFRNESGRADGYSVALCLAIAERLQRELGIAKLPVKWVEVAFADRFRAIQEQRVDLLCSDALTLASRKEIAYSIPVYPGGIGAMLRRDALARLRETLTEAQPTQRRPLWRASPAQILSQQTFSAVAGTPSEKWLNEKLSEFKIAAKTAPVSGYEQGIEEIRNGNSNVFFAERAILLEATKDKDDLIVIDRRYTYAPLAVGLAKNEDDFRLLIDRTLSRLFASPEFKVMYTRWFGEPDEDTLKFFQLSILPE